MLDEVPEFLKVEQAAVEAEIRAAFLGVTREGGVSWAESTVIDDWGDAEERERFRALDVEKRWEDLVDDAAWDYETGSGGFNFLDPIGFRYYIAPAMVRCLREWDAEGLTLQLGLFGKLRTNQVSLFTRAQANAVMRFLRCMIEFGRNQGLSSNWRGFPSLQDAHDSWVQRIARLPTEK